MANRSFVRTLLVIGLLSVSLSGCTLVSRVARLIQDPLAPLRQPVAQATAAPAATETPLPSPTMAPAPTATAVPPDAPTALPAAPSGVLSDEEILDIAEALTVQVYEQVSPSVVYITSRVVQMDYWGYMYPSEGTGSGFVIDTEGHIVTNNHVIDGAGAARVTLADGSTWP
ncbi:MAG: hypothetical protein GX557_02320, partial [Chloroflexi bacterium]|nr:hypothetical protein [Chloroflexota bacterium]